MTDKEITTKDVDVRGCKFFRNGICASPINTKCKLCVEISEKMCYYKQLARKKQECERLKEEVSLLKESNSKLQQIEDVNSLEKCYLQQLDQLKAKEQECEELKKTIMYKCPQCGEVYLSPIGSSLYEENNNLKQTLIEIKPTLELYASSKIGEEQLDGTYKITVKNSSILGDTYITFDPRPAKQALQKIRECELKDEHR